MDLQTIVCNHSAAFVGDNIFVLPNIPVDKLRNVLSSYAKQGASAIGCGDEHALVLYDNTVFGSAKDGMLITDRAIYAHDMAEEFCFVALEDVKKTRIVDGLGSTELHINDSLFVTLNIDPENAVPICDILQDVVNGGFSLCTTKVNKTESGKCLCCGAPRSAARGKCEYCDAPY